MRDRAQRAERDRAAAAEHDERVAAGEERILARGADGALVSYRPEEYGFLKDGGGRPTAKTIWGMGALALFLAVLTTFMAVAFARALAAGEDVPWGVWFAPALGGLLCALSLRHLRQEWRARRLRRERGLPRPVS